VHGTGQVVDEDRPADPDLVTQQPGIGQLAVERIVVRDVFARMGFAGVDKRPVGLGMPGGRGV
jgi:hypothetical protein